jgi:hypothetical protein
VNVIFSEVVGTSHSNGLCVYPLHVRIMSGSLMWDVVVQDTHVLARMFAAAVDGLMNI